MDVQKLVWSCLVLLTGILGQMVPEVHYEDPQCAVKGSTVNVPCTFRSIDKVVRVRWCVNHEMCVGTTPSVYDSRSPGLHPRYRYLGDWTGNCSLQIRDLELEDNNTFRFRMETQDRQRDFTGRQGVKVTVDGTARMRISSSRVGDNIVLSCSSDCTYHDLSFTWSKDHLTTLEETGPSLTLTEADHGNYSCGLKDKIWTRSDPFTLLVPAPQQRHLLAVRVLLFSLHTLLIIAMATIIIKWTCVCRAQ